MLINTNCLLYEGSKPCIFHKKDGRLCDNCTDYVPIKSNILIVKLAALGDVLRTTSILPNLKSKFPESRITWVSKVNALPVLKSNPYIHRFFAIEGNYLEHILTEKFDLGICLDSDSLSASILSIANCRTKLGFIVNELGNPVPANTESEEWWFMGLNDNLKIQNRKTYQEIIHNICQLDYIKHPPIINTEILNHGLLNSFIKDNNIDTTKQVIGINTGGGNRWQWKKWILDYYIKFIQLIKSNHPANQIILFGGPEEIEFNQQIINAVGSSVIDAGCGNNLIDFISKVSISNLFITPDSLGFHISTALKIKTFVLVGPTSPFELEVYDNGEIIYPDIDCIVCYLNTCTKKQNCMELIILDYLYKKLKPHLQ